MILLQQVRRQQGIIDMSSILRSDPAAFQGDEVIIYEDVETLKEMFRYKIRPNNTHKEIIRQMQIYLDENEKFMKRKNKQAARRARIALLELFHLVRTRRIEMLSIYKMEDFRDPDFRI